MKRYQSAFKVLLCALLSAGVATSALAKGTNIDTGKIQSQLKAVVLPELPVQAATIVKKAKRNSKNQTAAAVVREAIAINPALGVSVVGAIAKAEPKVADVVAVEAAKLQPVNLMAITKAATVAAPKQTRQIVYSLTVNFPQEFNSILAAAILHQPTEENVVNAMSGMDYAIPGMIDLLSGVTSVEMIEAITGPIVNVQIRNLPVTTLVALVEALQAAYSVSGEVTDAAGNTQTVKAPTLSFEDVLKAVVNLPQGVDPTNLDAVTTVLNADTQLQNKVQAKTNQAQQKVIQEAKKINKDAPAPTPTEPAGTVSQADKDAAAAKITAVQNTNVALVTVSQVVQNVTQNNFSVQNLKFKGQVINYAAVKADGSPAPSLSETVAVSDGATLFTLDSWLTVYTVLGDKIKNPGTLVPYTP